MTIVNPKALDKRIQGTQVQFQAKLFIGKEYTAYGRAFLNDEGDEGQTPAV